MLCKLQISRHFLTDMYVLNMGCFESEMVEGGEKVKGEDFHNAAPERWRSHLRHSF